MRLRFRSPIRFVTDLPAGRGGVLDPGPGGAGRGRGAPDAGSRGPGGRRPGRRLSSILLRLFLAAALVAGLVALGVRGREFLYESTYFSIRNIEISGAGAETTARIQALLDSDEGPRSLLEASPRRIRDLVLRAPEVKEVVVRRRAPDTLIIDVAQRHPVAVLVGERNVLIDSDLVAMGSISGLDFVESRLPLITLDPPPAIEMGAPIDDERLARAWAVVGELRRRSPDLAMKIAETHAGENGEIALHFEGGAEARLGLRPSAQVLPVLEAFYHKTNGMESLEYAELQYRNQVAFKRRGAPSFPAPARGGSSRDRDSLPSHRKGD